MVSPASAPVGVSAVCCWLRLALAFLLLGTQLLSIRCRPYPVMPRADGALSARLSVGGYEEKSRDGYGGQTRERSPLAVERWYALDPDDVAHVLGVVLESGLSQSEAARRLATDGPNALPVEQPPSPLRRFLAQFTSYMQLILVGAAVVSLLIKQWTTAVVLGVISLFNALTGLRQAGKAESAMNALQSMMKATAQCDATESRR